MTWSGTVMFLGKRSRSLSPSSLLTMSHVYLSIGNTSSSGTRNATRRVRHNPSLVASGFPQCSTLSTPCGLCAGTSAPNISYTRSLKYYLRNKTIYFIEQLKKLRLSIWPVCVCVYILCNFYYIFVNNYVFLFLLCFIYVVVYKL